MSVTKLEYYHIAEVQIETAIDLFNEKNFICAITLAGAGEEILGNLLHPSIENAMKAIVKEISILFPDITEKDIRDNELNIVRNGFKHLKESICEQDIDLPTQAFQYIARACINYAKLRQRLTPKMISFGEANQQSSFEASKANVSK